MRLIKGFLILLCYLCCFCTISGAFASEKTSDDMNDFSHYTTASKIAYAASWNLFRFYGTLVPGDMDTMSDVADYFTQLNQRSNQHEQRTAYVVNISIDDLHPGDIVHVKNSVYPFMIYKGYNNVVRDNDTDAIVLESLMDRYVCDPTTFNQIFDGYAIMFPVNSSETQFAINHRVNGSNITDDPIYNNTIGSPTYVGNSLYVKFWNKNQFNSTSTDTSQIKNFVDNLLNNRGGTVISDVDKAECIFNWVKNHVGYSGTYVGTTWFSTFAIDSTMDGNSCDQARLVYAMGKVAGLNVVFHKSYSQFPSGQFAHVWTDIQVNGTWLPADTTSKQNNLGNTTYSQIIDDYGTYDMLDC